MERRFKSPAYAVKTNLIINYYVDKHEGRANELKTCLKHNLDNVYIDNVIVIADQETSDYLTDEIESDKIDYLITPDRPVFNDYFHLTDNYKNDLNILSNTDIIIPEESIAQMQEACKDYNTILALTRYDLSVNLDFENALFFDRPDSQDVWVKRGRFPNTPKANFTMGVGGCDNVIAHLLSDAHRVINPSRTIKTYHLHNSNIRNYIKPKVGTYRLNPPYKLLPPTL